MKKIIIGVVLGLLALTAQATTLELTPCHVKGLKTQVECATLVVPLDYQNPDKGSLSLNIVKVAALEASKQPDPVFFLAGGPGQAATEITAMATTMLAQLRLKRDLIFIDQRGTGKSSPLVCLDDEEIDIYSLDSTTLSQQDIQQCLDSYTVDVTHFSTMNAIRDFDQVRQALNVEKVNLYGGSYGTRAALVYQKMFPQTIRSMILDSVGPIEVEIGPFGQSSARSFDLLLADCLQNTFCSQSYPNLRAEFDAVMARLAQPIDVEILHPTLAYKTLLKIEKIKFVNMLRQQLYSGSGRELVPLLIHETYKENYLPFAGLLAISSQDTGGGMYMGLTLNIVCNEDFARVSESQLQQDAANNFDNNASHFVWQLACPLWPKYTVDDSFYQPVTSDIPTLVLSGNLDPVTPPANGDIAMQGLTNVQHIVVDQGAHIQGVFPCVQTIMARFVDQASFNDLDQSCVQDIQPVNYIIGLN